MEGIIEPLREQEANDNEPRKRCVWNELGNFNSNLSALT
jgi:hypothetical protein